MGWAAYYIEELKACRTVSFRPRGNSMTGRVESGQLCTVVPVLLPTDVEVGDVVLCRVGAAEYLHLVKAISPSKGKPERYLIGNNRGRTNGWTEARNVFGKLTVVAP